MVAVVFPGQGSQAVGMGQDLVRHSPEAQSVFHEVSQAVGRDLAQLCFESDEETLRQTQNAQIALYTVGLAAFKTLTEALGGAFVPSSMAGHSIGEYTALAAAGVISVPDGARLVQRRGELMAQAGTTRPGTMAAILGVESEALAQICREASSATETVVVANDNCPGQLVISGDPAAVERAGQLASEAGAKRVLPLKVSGAFHSPLMLDSAAQMRPALDSVTWTVSTETPVVYSNVTAQPVSTGADWPELLERQLSSPVRWTESVQQMVRDGVTQVVECGSGQVLTGLAKRIDKGVVAFSVSDFATATETAKGLTEGRI